MCIVWGLGKMMEWNLEIEIVTISSVVRFLPTVQVQVATINYISPYRDGSAVELQGLCYSAVSWLAKLHQKGIYPHSGIKTISEALGKTTIYLK